MTSANIALLVDLQNGFVKDDLPVPGGEEIANPGARLIEHIKRSKELWSVILSQDWHPKGHISFASSHKKPEPYRTIYLKTEYDNTNRAVAAIEDDKLYAVRTDRRGHVLYLRHERPLADVPEGAVKQTLWPDHCIQGTHSAQILDSIFETLPPTLQIMLRSDDFNFDYIFSATDKLDHPITVIRKGYNLRHDSYSLVKDNGGITETPAREYFEDLGKTLQKQGVTNVNVFFGGLATDYCVDWSYTDTHALLPGILKKYGVEAANFIFLPDISRGIDPEKSKTIEARWAAEGVRRTTVDDIIRATTPLRGLSTRPLFDPE